MSSETKASSTNDPVSATLDSLPVVLRVTLNGDFVAVDRNPETVGPRATVIWQLPGLRRDLTVEFSAVRDITTATPSDFLPTGPLGPLSSLQHLGDRIEGLVHNFAVDPDPTRNRQYRFFYKILRDGEPLKWDPRVELGDQINGGGLDTSRRPPTGG